MSDIKNDQIMFGGLDLVYNLLDKTMILAKSDESARLLTEARDNVAKVIQADYPSLIREKAEAQAQVKAEKEARKGVHSHE